MGIDFRLEFVMFITKYSRISIHFCFSLFNSNERYLSFLGSLDVYPKAVQLWKLDWTAGLQSQVVFPCGLRSTCRPLSLEGLWFDSTKIFEQWRLHHLSMLVWLWLSLKCFFEWFRAFVCQIKSTLRLLLIRLSVNCLYIAVKTHVVLPFVKAGTCCIKTLKWVSSMTALLKLLHVSAIQPDTVLLLEI